MLEPARDLLRGPQHPKPLSHDARHARFLGQLATLGTPSPLSRCFIGQARAVAFAVSIALDLTTDRRWGPAWPCCRGANRFTCKTASEISSRSARVSAVDAPDRAAGGCHQSGQDSFGSTCEVDQRACQSLAASSLASSAPTSAPSGWRKVDSWPSHMK
jgi:hypothetical protein